MKIISLKNKKQTEQDGRYLKNIFRVSIDVEQISKCVL